MPALCTLFVWDRLAEKRSTHRNAGQVSKFLLIRTENLCTIIENSAPNCAKRPEKCRYKSIFQKRSMRFSAEIGELSTNHRWKNLRSVPVGGGLKTFRAGISHSLVKNNMLEIGLVSWSRITPEPALQPPVMLSDKLEMYIQCAGSRRQLAPARGIIPAVTRPNYTW